MEKLYIDRVLKGEHNAFRFIVHQYKDMAFNIAMSILKDEFDSKDAVQEAFIISFRKLSTYRRTSKFSTWFYRIVYNTGLTVISNKKHQVQMEMNSIDDFHSLKEVDEEIS